ncbi:MAG: UTP--glucose-1-phosphate uridylyltransferase [Pirellulales bacterium]
MSLDLNLVDQLHAFGQSTLAEHWQQLSPKQQATLGEQLAQIDLAEIKRAFASKTAAGSAENLEQLEPPPAIRLNDAEPMISAADAYQAGEELLAAGKTASILVAGGQGTRLGFDHPKGMFPIGPVSEMTLFQIHFEKLIARSKRYGVRIPLYLMTSPATHEETIAYLESQNYFGIAAEDRQVFCQGTMPAVDHQTGQLLLSSADSLALSPDGHGGTLAALANCGALDTMQQQGIESIYYFQVDNPLADVCEPLFLGYHKLSQSQKSTQVIAKQFPEEKLGILAALAGKVRMVEYSELPTELAAATNEQGSLKYWAGNIAVHAFEVDFLQKMVETADSLPWHLAHKKVPYVDASGNVVSPEEPNAIKFERFIFDLLPSAQNALVVEVDPATTFAPVKNANGAATDTPDSVKAAISALHRAWLKQCNVDVKADVPVEISPLIALDAEQLKPQITGLDSITEPTLFS